ncbi:hypothetical protein IQ07DRAFT_217983 [Pyrenochaeta sp. DS3sAY3a]|nr:hypothetical protein IQ07DRAFT_217983 [Pyrenochaeta sp. DS3sAY3a]
MSTMYPLLSRDEAAKTKFANHSMHTRLLSAQRHHPGTTNPKPTNPAKQPPKNPHAKSLTRARQDFVPQTTKIHPACDSQTTQPFLLRKLKSYHAKPQNPPSPCQAALPFAHGNPSTPARTSHAAIPLPYAHQRTLDTQATSELPACIVAVQAARVDRRRSRCARQTAGQRDQTAACCCLLRSLGLAGARHWLDDVGVGGALFAQPPPLLAGVHHGRARACWVSERASEGPFVSGLVLGRVWGWAGRAWGESQLSLSWELLSWFLFAGLESVCL